MATAQSVPFTVCEPFTEEMAKANERFERHQFAHSVRGAAFAASGISYRDYDRMHIKRNSMYSARQSPIPRWVTDKKLLRETILVYLERANYVRPAPGATNEQRLAVVKAEALRLVARKKIVLDRLVADKASVVEIQNVDTQVVIAKRQAEIVAGVVYYGWLLGWDSVTVASTLRIKSPHVRIIMWRLKKIGKLLQEGLPAGRSAPKEPLTPPPMKEQRGKKGRPCKWTAERMDWIASQRAAGKNWLQIGQAFSFKNPMHCCVYYNTLRRKHADAK